MAESGFRDLREFVGYVEKRGLLRRVKVAVSREFEIAEITSRAARLPGGGPALLFEKVKGSALPVITNLTGSAQRLAWSLSLNGLAELEQRMGSLLQPPPLDFGERLARLGEISQTGRYAPRIVKSGPCQEVVRQDGAALTLLPTLKCWPEERGAAIRLLPVFSRGSDGDLEISAGHLVVDKDQVYLSGVKVGPGERKAVALVVGGDPAVMFTARAPFLPGTDRLMIAGGLVRRRIELVRCKTVELEVPATAEMVIEGYVEASGQLGELKLGRADGYYGEIDEMARFTFTALTHRQDPLFVMTVGGPLPNEEVTLVKGSERLLLPLLKVAAPEIVDICLPVEGAVYNLLVVAIRKRYAGQAQKVMYGLWGMEQLRLVKNIVVVDEDCPIHEPSQVAARVLGLADPANDWLVVKGPLEGAVALGAKAGLDATRKLPGEGRPVAPVQSQPEIRRLVDEKWLEYGIE